MWTRCAQARADKRAQSVAAAAQPCLAVGPELKLQELVAELALVPHVVAQVELALRRHGPGSAGRGEWNASAFLRACARRPATSVQPLDCAMEVTLAVKLEVLDYAVSSVTESVMMAARCERGPTWRARQKPTLCAPGARRIGWRGDQRAPGAGACVARGQRAAAASAAGSALTGGDRRSRHIAALLLLDRPCGRCHMLGVRQGSTNR